MLAELIQYYATPATAEIRRAGHLREALALWVRGRRCREAWAPHEARSRAAIDRAIDSTTQRRVAVVLGSGLLRDVPIERLRSMFRKVVLVDVVHLASVRLRARLARWDNVSFLVRDVSGLDDLAEHERLRRSIGKDDIGARLDPLSFLRRIDDLDLVVSANLLSQIAVGAERRLASERRLFAMPEDTVARLVRAHVEGLAAQECRTVLVTDVDYVKRDREGVVREAVDLLHGVPLPAPDDAWSWPVAPFGEEPGDLERVHRVTALLDPAVDLG